MKNNLENAFKDKLTEFEAPYDPQAWEAVKGQLDAKATGGGSSSAWKWIAATAVVATIAVTSIMVLDNTETTIADTNTISKEETPKNEIEKSTVDSDDKNAALNPTNEEIEGSNQNTIQESDENSVEETTLEEVSNNEVVSPERNTKPDNISETVTPSEGEETQVPDNVQETATPIKKKYIAGNITANEVCAGEQITITNNGAKNEIVRFEANGKIIELKKANSFIITPKISSVINFVNRDNKIIDSEFIKVNELPNPDFSIEANIYEQGLPVTICEAYGDFKELTWDFDGKAEKNGKNVKHNFFEKGSYTITLKVTDFNGCKNSKQRDVRIDDQYNLMAVDAFKPNGSDPKTKAFMPFSLTQRDIQFTLTIIDPRDNGIVFTSKDASNPWTGIDERTGKMTESEKVFIWRVQIENSLPNERPVYAGTVVHN